MKSAKGNPKLPNEVEAVSFVCRCFGIGREELDLTLERARGFTPQAEKCFPPKIWRETVRRAKRGKDSGQDSTKIIHHEALYDRVRRCRGKPSWSFTGKLTDELTSVMLSLYARLLPKLDLGGNSTANALWLLVENVFVPTAFIKLVQEWRFGLGNEFLGEVCWYLPIESRGQIQKPLPRVLDYWMRVAGFQTAYQVAKAAGERSLRRRIDRWLEGEIVPNPPDLHRLVHKFSARLSWLDEPSTWKARFTLACAMQNVCDLMDEYFRPIRKNSSLALIKMIRSISKNRIVCDDEKFLAGAHSFFAARLLQRQLQAVKMWNPVPPNYGNWFLEEIQRMAVADGFLKRSNLGVENYVVLEEYLFGLGVRELNRLLESKAERGRRAVARRP